jgi:SIR2-like domain
MDGFLIDYLKSGQAWVLVGSGPSIAMGYPSWRELALVALESVKLDKGSSGLGSAEAAMKRNDFPFVFEECKKILGGPRLTQALQDRLTARNQSQIYKLIARWPVQVYLTTNYDDEIQRQLVELNEAYVIYSNSEDHMGHLLPSLRGAIFKLHGDLRSETGLILTTSQYREITSSVQWNYWRTKMISVFQMNRVVVIGHSLSDSNIKHVLAAAKQGAGVHQPICWLAPDVSTSQGREYLEKYRIRVISYDNRDGEHRNLNHLIETISEFVPPRQTIRIQEQIARSYQSPLGNNAAAPGFFVFNKLVLQNDHDQKRLDVVLAIIQSALPLLASMEPFTLDKILEIAGWPKDAPLATPFAETVCRRAVDLGLLAPSAGKFRVGDKADSLAAGNRQDFEHLRERFKSSLQLRLRKHYPALDGEEATKIASDIEASLTGYFKEGGLTLATTLFSKRQRRSQAVPSSIIKFINEASARYDDLLRRQAFSTVSIEAFVGAESAEREYLGRISQGFFAFHSLGVFGEVAIERLKEAKKTVWLIDSSAQISALALAASTNSAFADSFSRLKTAGVRLFTTEKLFDETCEHLRFATGCHQTPWGGFFCCSRSRERRIALSQIQPVPRGIYKMAIRRKPL